MSWATDASTVIPVTCTGVSAIILAMTKWQADKVQSQREEIAGLKVRVGSLEEQQVKDRSMFRDAIRYIRAQVAHGLELTGLLAAHAPHIPIPPAPPLPDAIRDEV